MNTSEKLAFDLDDLSALLPLSKSQLYEAFAKTGTTTGLLSAACLSVSVAKHGTRWIAVRAVWEQAVVEVGTPVSCVQQPASASMNPKEEKHIELL